MESGLKVVKGLSTSLFVVAGPPRGALAGFVVPVASGGFGSVGQNGRPVSAKEDGEVTSERVGRSRDQIGGRVSIIALPSVRLELHSQVLV